MYPVWKWATTSTNRIKSAIFAIGFTAALFLPMLSNPNIAHADNVVLPASSWLTGLGGGVDVMSGGDGTHNCVPVAGAPGGSGCSAGNVYSGDKWQCVEMVNRLYLSKGWTTTTWWGNGNSSINDMSHHPGLTAQLNGSVSFVNPGDVITLDDGNFGHAAIINSGTTTLNIINQNATLNSTATIVYGSLSTGNASYNSSWFGYSVQYIIHHPGSGGGGTGLSAARSDVDNNGRADLFAMVPKTGGVDAYSLLSLASPNRFSTHYWWNGTGLGWSGSRH